jgi:hypothetical protein
VFATLDAASILSVLALILVPGVSLAVVACDPDSTRPQTLLAASLGLGYAAVLVVSFGLALAHVLERPWILVAWAAVSIAAAATAVATGRAGRHLRTARRDLAASPIAATADVVVIATLCVVRTSFVPVVNIDPTTLRYWADAVEISDAHGFWPTTLQWDRVLPQTVSKVGLNAFNADVATLLGRAPLRPLGALLFVVSIGLGVMLIALAREIGLRAAAPIVPVLALLAPGGAFLRSNLARDLNHNLAENWGRLVAFAALVLAIRVVQRATAGPSGDTAAGEAAVPEARRPTIARGELVAVGVLLGAASVTHLVATVAVGGLLAVYTLASIAWSWSAAETRAAIGSVAAIAAIAIGIGAAGIVLAPGEEGFAGAFDQAAYRAVVERNHLPPDFDPTRFIATGRVHGGPTIDTRAVVASFERSVTGRPTSGASGVGPGGLPVPEMALLGAGLAGVLVFGGRSLRIVATTCVAFALLLLGVALAFAVHYHEFALAAFGPRRLFDYLALVWALAAALVLELVWVRASAGRALADAGSLLVTVALLAALAPAARAPADAVRPGASEMALLSWIRANVPCDGRVLLDRRTLATFETMTGHAGVVEGMGPHIRPSVLTIAIQRILEATTFFQDPASGRAYLARNGVAAVVVSTYAHPLGGWLRLDGERTRAVAGTPYLVPEFRNAAGIVYGVEGFTPNASLPSVAGRPGYDCPSPSVP